MGINLQDIFARTYALLQSLRVNVASLSSSVPEQYVVEFHSALDRLHSIGFDMADFRIPHTEIQTQAYFKGKYIAKAFLLTKLDAVLLYFQLTTGETPRKIGFHPPK